MSETKSGSLNAYARRCGVVLAAVVCGTLVMVGTSYSGISNQALRTGIILGAACVNASLVAGMLMHLVSERRAILAVLAFTAIFFTGLMGLSIWATHDVPALLKP